MLRYLIFHQVKFKSRWNSDSIKSAPVSSTMMVISSTDDWIAGSKGWVYMVGNPSDCDFDDCHGSDFGELMIISWVWRWCNFWYERKRVVYSVNFQIPF